MKLIYGIICLCVLVLISEADEDDGSFLEQVFKGRKRICKMPGGECKNDCNCCYRHTYCNCPLWGAFGCSCIHGDSMVCKRKKEQCSDPMVKDFPRGSCFSG